MRFSVDGWQTWADLDALETGVGVWVADVPGANRLRHGAGVDFTMWWPEAGHWEGRDLRVTVSRPVDSGPTGSSSS